VRGKRRGRCDYYQNVSERNDEGLSSFRFRSTKGCLKKGGDWWEGSTQLVSKKDGKGGKKKKRIHVARRRCKHQRPQGGTIEEG